MIAHTRITSPRLASETRPTGDIHFPTAEGCPVPSVPTAALLEVTAPKPPSEELSASDIMCQEQRRPRTSLVS